MASLYSNVANFALPVGKKKKAIFWITMFLGFFFFCFFLAILTFYLSFYVCKNVNSGKSYYSLCKSLEHYLFASITVSSSIYVRFMEQLEIFPCSARYAL